MRILVVLGMHRSGTSALARVCNLLGADLGKHLLSAQPDNPTGFWELEKISSIHDEILAAQGSRWDDIREFPANWWQASSVNSFKDRLTEVARREFADSKLACIKDPRISRLLPLWQAIFRRLDWAPRYIFIVRNPLEVAASLASRDGFGPYRSHLIWLRYALEAERWTRGTTRALIDYEDLLGNWRETMNAAWRRLDLGDLKIGSETTTLVDQFLQSDLRHHSAAPDDLERDRQSALVRAVYRNYRAAVESDAPRAHQALAESEKSLANAGILFERIIDDESAARAKLEGERRSFALENSNLRNTMSEAGAEIEALRQTVEQRSVEVARLTVEVAEQEREVHVMRSSASWRITAPIRDARATLHRLTLGARVATANYARWLFHKVPLSADNKSRIKSYVITHTNLLHRSAGSDDQTYSEWLQSYDTLTDIDREAIQRHAAMLERKPLISVIMPVFNTSEAFLRCAIQSVADQIYGHWELCIADDCSTEPHVAEVIKEYQNKYDRIKAVFRDRNGNIAACSNSALELATGEFIALMDHDDMLAVNALYMVAVAINEHPNAALIYSDEDTIDENGARHPAYFKSDWNPDLFYSQNMISHLGAYRDSLVKDLSGFTVGLEGSQDYDFALRAIEKTTSETIIHIPHVLYHWRRCSSATSFSQQQLSRAAAAARRAVSGHFQRRGIDVKVELAPGMPQYQRMRWPIPSAPPLVSLIIPIRDNVKVLRQCLDGILLRTDYVSLEVLIVNNGSVEPETLAYLKQVSENARVRVLDYNQPFNYSAINNFAIRRAQGSIIGLINNDIDVINEDWLTELVGQTLRPEVGAVGAKLIYPDDTVQHAGIITGLCGGVAAHGHRHLDRADIGYFGRLKLAQNVSAVTGACLFTRREIFDACGWLDETNLAVAYNDVDFCLRIRARGYLIVWTPFAELYHLESASRGADTAAKHAQRFAREQAWMKARWKESLPNDPYYSPNLTLDREDFSLAFPPRAIKPWVSYQMN